MVVVTPGPATNATAAPQNLYLASDVGDDGERDTWVGESPTRAEIAAELEVTLRSGDDAEPGWVRVEVVDRGIGDGLASFHSGSIDTG